MKITSSAFKDGEGIPEIYTCKGKDISPPLAWSDLPADTVSLVMIMDDPDAPVGTWDHWIVFNIPSSSTELGQDIQLYPAGAKPGKNSWKRNDYGGPCPPGGARHRYFFKLYALDITLNLEDGASKAEILKAMQSHVLADAQLVGIYKP